MPYIKQNLKLTVRGAHELDASRTGMKAAYDEARRNARFTDYLGKLMLTNTLVIWATCAADPFDDELKYRIIRATSIMMVFFLGSFSKDSLVALTTGWAEDMRVPTFVQNFVVTYYVLNCWASADFKLKAK